MRALPALLLALAMPALAGTVTTTVIQATGERPSGPVTFAQPFARGDIPTTLRATVVTVTADGLRVVRPSEAQVDEKRRWSDGSLKHAVVTVVLPPMAEGECAEVRMSDATDSTGGAPVLKPCPPLVDATPSPIPPPPDPPPAPPPPPPPAPPPPAPPPPAPPPPGCDTTTGGCPSPTTPPPACMCPCACSSPTSTGTP